MRFNGSVSGGVSGMMEILGEGDTIEIIPALTSGVEVATFKINEGTAEDETIKLYAPQGFSGSWNDLTDKPDLFSGSYNDLTNRPNYNGSVITGNVYGLDFNGNDDRVVGRNIDGKLIYCKVVDVTLNTSPLAIELPSNTYQFLGILYGTIDNPNYTLHFPYYDSPTYWSVSEYHKDDHSLYINSSTAMIQYYDTIHLNILYTLST